MSIEAALVEVLRAEAGHRYCPGCLALRIGASLEETRAALVGVQRNTEFRSVMDACSGCGRKLSLTGLAQPARAAPP